VLPQSYWHFINGKVSREDSGAAFKGRSLLIYPQVTTSHIDPEQNGNSPEISHIGLNMVGFEMGWDRTGKQDLWHYVGWHLDLGIWTCRFRVHQAEFQLFIKSQVLHTSIKT
jgi:hypothetical protein